MDVNHKKVKVNLFLYRKNEVVAPFFNDDGDWSNSQLIIARTPPSLFLRLCRSNLNRDRAAGQPLSASDGVQHLGPGRRDA